MNAARGAWRWNRPACWIPAFEYLEEQGFSVLPAPPKPTRRIGGRKSDALDCQWICQLMAHDLLRGCFRTPNAMRARNIMDGPAALEPARHGEDGVVPDKGSAKAIKATARELARIVRAMLKAGQAYVEKGVATFEEQRKKRKIASLKRMAASLDLELILPTNDASAESAARP